jgi:hypothetical protein
VAILAMLFPIKKELCKNDVKKGSKKRKKAFCD